MILIKLGCSKHQLNEDFLGLSREARDIDGMLFGLGLKNDILLKASKRYVIAMKIFILSKL